MGFDVNFASRNFDAGVNNQRRLELADGHLSPFNAQRQELPWVLSNITGEAQDLALQAMAKKKRRLDVNA